MTQKQDHTHHHSDESYQPMGDNIAICPVMKGIPVDMEEAEKLGRVREFNAKKYYLCCDDCVADFDANPEYYAN